MSKLDPMLERAVRNAWRLCDIWGAPDNFITELQREIEVGQRNEARRSITPTQETSSAKGDPEPGRT